MYPTSPPVPAVLGNPDGTELIRIDSAQIGPVFGTFGTYATYQLQYISYAIGANPGQPMGSGCLDLAQACRVPFGASDINLTSLILYLNALAFAISGALCLIVSGVGDYMGKSARPLNRNPAPRSQCERVPSTGYKREQYIGFLLVYGAFALPVAGLTAYNLSDFNTYCALYVVFFTVGFLAGAWQNVFIPDVMHGETARLAATSAEETRREREIRGVNTSVWGFNAYQGSLIVFYCITIGIAFASPEAATKAGLWVTTATASLCIVLSLVAWPFLPSPSAKPLPAGVSVWKLPFLTLYELWRACTKYPEAMKYLAAFTIYNDSVFAFSAVIGQLYNLQLRPSVLEYTYYSIVGCGTSIIAPTLWMYFFRRTDWISLRTWTIISYGLVAFTALWCCIGFSDSARVGFKSRWEFYLFQVVQNIAFSLMSALFRVLYSELFPKRAEVQYFSFQLAIACGTVWIPQVVDSAIVDATNLVRLPAAVALAMILVAIGLTFWTDIEKGVRMVEQAEVEDVGLDVPKQDFESVA
ncbi:hypothetical protein JCM11491_003662 [Sporobolomyces phaffii]